MWTRSKESGGGDIQRVGAPVAEFHVLAASRNEVPRRSLEALAVDAYRAIVLSENRVRRLLNRELRF